MITGFLSLFCLGESPGPGRMDEKFMAEWGLVWEMGQEQK